MIAKFRWHCISFFNIVRNVNHVKNSLHPRNSKVVINHRVGNFTEFNVVLPLYKKSSYTSYPEASCLNKSICLFYFIFNKETTI